MTMLWNTLILFNSLSAIAAILAALVLGTVIYTGIQRSKAWFSLLFACLIYSSSLLILIGRQTGPPPPFGLCVLQAALVYAGPAFLAYSFTCLIVEFNFQLMVALHCMQLSRFGVLALDFSPWAMFEFVFILSILVVPNFSGVERDSASHMYCHVVSTATPSYVTAAIVVFSFVVGLFFEVRIGIVLRRNWNAFKEISRANPMLSWSLYLRICSFNVSALIAQGLSIYVLSNSSESGNLSFWKLLLPLVPIFSTIAFGTQRDIVVAWMFWRWEKRKEIWNA